MAKKPTISKRQLKLQEQIKAKNLAFKKMSPAQKRIAIAQDVLSSLKKGKLVAEHRTYCEFGLNSEKLSKNLAGKNQGDEVQMQELLIDNSIEKCKVCAIGSMFVAKVSIGNDFKLQVEEDWGELSIDDELNDDRKLIHSLRGIFTPTQLRYIEYAFEGEDIAETFDLKGDKFHDKVRDFHDSHNNADERLKAIMKNIIKNEGEFKL